MSDLDHKVGVKEANLVKRTLALTGLQENERTPMCEEIAQLLGIDEVSFEQQSEKLSIAYDPTHVDLDDIEGIVQRHGAEIAANWWNRVKTGYYRFVDQNVRDNAKHQPHCCHKLPPGHQRRK